MVPFRYAPKEVDKYPQTRGKRCNRMWYFEQGMFNLAWLSLPIEKSPQVYELTEKDEELVRRTARWDLTYHRVSRRSFDPPHTILESFFVLPPAEAIERIRHYPHYQRLPLYRANGEKWFDTMQARIGLCRTHPLEVECGPDDEAAQMLSEIFGRASRAG